VKSPSLYGDLTRCRMSLKLVDYERWKVAILRGVLEYWRNKNFKSQISNIKQITMTKIPNSKPVLFIEYWNLRFVCNLVLGI
jgi:capsule polysaccharide modification protein KpsS